MAGEAKLTVDGLTFDEQLVLFAGILAAADLVGAGEDHGAELLHALGGGREQDLLLELGIIRPGFDVIRAKDLGGHDGLQGYVRILVGAELGEIFDEGLVAGADQGLAGTEALATEVRVLIREERAHGLGVERTEAFERPERVDTAERFLTPEGELGERGDDGLVALEHQEFLRGIAPPAVGV